MENGLESLNFKLYDGETVIHTGTVPVRFLHLLTGNYLLKLNNNLRIEATYNSQTINYKYWLPPSD